MQISTCPTASGCACTARRASSVSISWPILLQGARGAVLLLDARRAGVVAELEDYLQVLRPFASSLALVVAVTHLDQAPHAALDDWAAVLP
jgi:signal recognition particle receptor subunit beta